MRPPTPRPIRASARGAGALLLTLAACVTGRGTPERPAVVSVDIEGVKGVSTSDILLGLVTHEPQGYGLSFAEPSTSYLDPDVIAGDRKRIERALAADGYYSAQVVDVRVEPKGKGKVAVTFKVDQGAPTLVQDVKVEGLEAAPELGRLPEHLPLRPGRVFIERDYDASRADLLGGLQSSGYAEAQVTQHAQVDPEARRAVVTYTVEPGIRYRFGNVYVAGAVSVPRSKVIRQAEIAVHPGALYDPAALTKAQSRVFDMGVFGGVRVSAGEPNPKAGTIPVVVSVRETPFRTVRVGPGVALQTTRFDAHVLAEWSDRNFLGDLRKLSLSGTAGYAWLPTVVNPDRQGPVGLFTADFTQPEALGREVDLGVRPELERSILEGYSFTSERVHFRLPLRFFQRWTLIPSYNLELYQLSNVPTLSEISTGAPTLLQSCPGASCVLSYLEQRVAWDGRDDPVETHRGLYVGLSLQEGFRLFDSAFRYLRFLPEVRGFVPLGPRMVLATRLRLGLLQPLPKGTDELEIQATPLVARFGSGGPNAMRGYTLRELSPVAKSLDSKGNFLFWAPVGGDGLVEGSAELRIRVSDEVGLVAFLDAGNVTLVSRDVLDLSRLQYAAGLGLRYRTPFGPIRLDVASRLPQPSSQGWRVPAVSEVGTTSAGCQSPGGCYTVVGQHSAPIVAVHISLGEAF